MKKLVLTIGCLVALTLGVNAIELSAGIGGDVGFIFTSLDTDISELDIMISTNIFESRDITRWGFSAFFDAQYIEVNLGFKYVVFPKNDDFNKRTQNFVILGLKLKYPFTITEKIKIFPLAGFDYSILIGGKVGFGVDSRYISYDRDDNLLSRGDHDRFDRFSINAGIGGDFYVGRNVYMRGEFNYAFLLNTKDQKERIDHIRSREYTISVFQSGPVFKLAIGYRFYNK